MAYMNQETKKAMAPAIKAALTKHGLKGSLSVRDHMTLVLKIQSGVINFEEDRKVENWYKPENGIDPGTEINQYHYENHWKGAALAAIEDLIKAMNVGNYDNSDTQTDYFDVGFYTDIKIGGWGKPYKLIA